MLLRATLDRTGGLRALVHLLAEDNVLGQRVRELGLSIGLADTVPAATVPEGNLRALWQHEIRWTCTNRALVPMALAASTLQYPLFWSALAIALSGGAPWSAGLFAVGWIVRGISVRGIDRALGPKVGRRADPVPLWLVPLRDILSVVEIVASYWIDEVTWRGHRIGTNARAPGPSEAATTTWPVPKEN
jgi:ceramide glucosyltransferase